MDIGDLPDDPDDAFDPDAAVDLDAAVDELELNISTRGMVPGFEAFAQAASAQVMGSFSGLGAAMTAEWTDRVGGSFAKQVGGDLAQRVGGDVFSGLSAAMGAQASGALLERIRPAASTAELIGLSADTGRVWAELASTKDMLRNVVDCSEVMTGMSAALGTNSALESMRGLGQSWWVAEAMKTSELDFVNRWDADLDAVVSGRVADPWVDDVVGGGTVTEVDDVLRGPPMESFAPPLPAAFVPAAVDQDVQVPDADAEVETVAAERVAPGRVWAALRFVMDCWNTMATTAMLVLTWLIWQLMQRQ